MSYIYVFECSNNKFYIGKTTVDVNSVFINHLSEANHCSFTNEYPPISIVESFESADSFDEDNTTKKYMMIYGIDNVRGGSYNKFKLEEWQIKSLENEFKTMNNICPDNKVNELSAYLNSFDTLEKINDEIVKIKKEYKQMLILQNQIARTSKYNLNMVEKIREDVTKITNKEKIENELRKLQSEHSNLKKNSSYGLILKNIQDKINYVKQQMINQGIEESGFNQCLNYHNNFYDELISTYKFIINNKNNDIGDRDYDIKILELINYNLDKKNELEKLLIKNDGEDNIKNKLSKLYEKRIVMIQ